jgi:hypothetical protein
MILVDKCLEKMKSFHYNSLNDKGSLLYVGDCYGERLNMATTMGIMSELYRSCILKLCMYDGVFLVVSLYLYI